jgi:hypothetical protein
MEVYPSPSRPYPISIPCFRWWSCRTLTTSYVTSMVLSPQIDKRPVSTLTPSESGTQKTFSYYFAMSRLGRWRHLRSYIIHVESISSKRCSQLWVHFSLTSTFNAFTLYLNHFTHLGRPKLGYPTWPRPTYHLPGLRTTMPPTLSFRRNRMPRVTT